MSDTTLYLDGKVTTETGCIVLSRCIRNLEDAEEISLSGIHRFKLTVDNGSRQSEIFLSEADVIALKAATKHVLG